MKIILSKDVQNLGEEGDIREVAAGYARNYLIPQGFGILYSKQNIALLEGRKKAIEKRKEEKKDRAKGLKDRIEAMDMKIEMTVGDSGRLFGSVTNSMIADELAKLGIDVERKRIEIPEHTIKTTGNFLLKVKLYGSEVASLKLTVAGPHGSQPPAAEPAAARTKESAATVEADATADERGEVEAPTKAAPEAEPAIEAEDQTETEAAVQEEAVVEDEPVDESEAAAADDPAADEPPADADDSADADDAADEESSEKE